MNTITKQKKKERGIGNVRAVLVHEVAEVAEHIVAGGVGDARDGGPHLVHERLQLLRALRRRLPVDRQVKAPQILGR